MTMLPTTTARNTIMIVFLAVVVGSIVIGMFLPLLYIFNHGFGGPGDGPDG